MGWLKMLCQDKSVVDVEPTRASKTKKFSTEIAIQQLRENKELLEKKEEYLAQKISEEIANAKKHGTKNKKMALRALKKKKRHEMELTQVSGTRENIEVQIGKLQESHANFEVFKAKASGAAALKQVHKNMKIDDVAEVMNEIEEQHEVAQEIGNELARSHPNNMVDEDELLEELEALEQEGLDEELLGIDLPNVPTSSLPAPTNAEKNKEIQQLENWMAA